MGDMQSDYQEFSSITTPDDIDHTSKGTNASLMFEFYVERRLSFRKTEQQGEIYQYLNLKGKKCTLISQQIN